MAGKRKAAGNSDLKTIHGQPSWTVRSSTVQAHITRMGGHLAPVTFDRTGRAIQPYAIAPWAEESIPNDLPDLLRALRGDFFCLPFGGNDTPYRKEQHPPHGETANRTWTHVAATSHADQHTLHLRLKVGTRPGVVDKRITLIDGHQAVYCQHTISRMSGPMPLGHHAMLRFPDEEAGGIISTSPLQFGLTAPQPVEQPAAKGYSCLQCNRRFQRMTSVPMITGEKADLSRYPARRGFEDIVILVNKPARDFAWTAVSFPAQRYVWFALKDPAVLGQTVMWLSNGGRHYEPWNGRHINTLGLEEVTAYFHYGLAPSVKPNDIAAAGSPTCVQLQPGKPLHVNYIMAVAITPRGFDRVNQIKPHRHEPAVTLTADSGKQVTVLLNWHFIRDGLPV